MRYALVILIVLAAPAVTRADPPPEGHATLTVMSFNIRYGTADDGPNHWRHRRGPVIEVIGEAAPDLVGVQEAIAFQHDYLNDELDDYEAIGVGRDDGKKRGEFASILYRRDRFDRLAVGTFWFSDTPEEPGSMSWGNQLPRICTWARLRDRRTDRVIRFYNVHLDHRSAPSRVRATAYLRERIGPPDDDLVIVAGDFNAVPDAPEMTSFVDSADDRLPLLDSFAVRHPEDTGGTFNGFQGRDDGRRIDYVFVDTRFVIEHAAILRAGPEPPVPSDHEPVTCRLRLDSDEKDVDKRDTSPASSDRPYSSARFP